MIHPEHRLCNAIDSTYLLYCRWRDFEVDSLPAHRSQQRNGVLALFAVAVLPSVQEVIVITWLIRKMKILVAVWGWENSLKRLAS